MTGHHTFWVKSTRSPSSIPDYLLHFEHAHNKVIYVMYIPESHFLQTDYKQKKSIIRILIQKLIFEMICCWVLFLSRKIKHTS